MLRRLFICSTRRENIHEDTRSNDRITLITPHKIIYIDADKGYLQSRKIIMILVKVIHKDYDPHGGIQRMKD